MSGARNGFYGRLSSYLADERQNLHTREGIPDRFIHSHCAAHKVELALSRAFEELSDDEMSLTKWRKFLTLFVNSLKSFYNNVAVTRLRGLKETAAEHHAEDDSIHFLKIKGIIKIRWVSSERVALINLVKMYKVLWNHLLEYIELPARSAKEKSMRVRAQIYVNIMQDLQFYTYITYEANLLRCFQTFSLLVQERKANLIHINDILDSFDHCIDSISNDPFSPYEIMKPKSHPGADSSQQPLKSIPFAMNVICKNGTDVVPASQKLKAREPDGLPAVCRNSLFGVRPFDPIEFELEYPKRIGQRGRYLDIARTQFRDPYADVHDEDFDNEVDDEENEARRSLDSERHAHATLLKSFKAANFAFLHEDRRREFGDSIKNRIRKEFKNEMISRMEGFTLRSLLAFPTEPEDVMKRREVAEIFNFDPDVIEEDVGVLRSSLAAELPPATFQKLQNDQLSDIAVLHYQLSKSEKINYQWKLQQLLDTSLSLALSSADVERAFSIIKLTVTDRRSRLLVDTLDLHMWIRLNGKPLKKWNLDRFVERYLQTHQAADDRTGTNLRTGDHSIFGGSTPEDGNDDEEVNISLAIPVFGNEPVLDFGN